MSIAPALQRTGPGRSIGTVQLRPQQAPRTQAPRTRTTLVFVGTLAAVFGLLISNLLRNLGTSRIADWDESRHAVSAYEMLQRGDWIGNTWRGQLDYWNLKPPLSMWAEMLSFQVFGYSTFAFRLPAAVATLLTVATVAYFSYRAAGRAAAVVSALGLSTSSHFLLTHNARTGDPDAIFLLGVTVALLAVLAAPRHPHLLLVATSAMSFAFLAKSFHALLLPLFAAGYLFATRRRSRIRVRDGLIALLGFLPLAGWIAVRYAYDGTAFLGSMFIVDVLHRTETPAEGNSAGMQYYSKILFTQSWPWLAVLAFAVALWLLASRRTREPLERSQVAVLIGLGIWSVSIVGVFSLMATKLAWYTLPAYPALSVMTGITVALALRSSPRPLRLALGSATAAAILLAQLPTMAAVSDPPEDESQEIFFSLHRDHRLLGRSVYLDSTRGWSQALVAAAELGGGLRPSDGGPDAAAREPGSLVLLPRTGVQAEMTGQIASTALRVSKSLFLVPAQALRGLDVEA